MNELTLLEKAGWPSNKNNFYGKAIYSFVDEFFNRLAITIDRDEKIIILSLTQSVAFDENSETSKVVIFDKKDENYFFNQDKSTINKLDVDKFLAEIKNKISIISIEPIFFATSVIKNDKLYKM